MVQHREIAVEAAERTPKTSSVMHCSKDDLISTAASLANAILFGMKAVLYP